MTPNERVTINCNKILAHFKNYCAEMGMNYKDWHKEIQMYQVMMEGYSPDRLRACFTHRITGKQLWFKLGKYDRKYVIEKLKD